MTRTYTFRQLRESRLLYDRKPPAFGVILTLLTLLFVVGGIVWAALSPKAYVVKATGLVASLNKVNLMNSVSGKIVSLEATEGQAVSAGDVILRLDSSPVQSQIVQLEAVASLYERRIAGVRKLISFVNGFRLDKPETQENPFSEADAELAKPYADAQGFIDYVTQQKGQEGGLTQEALDGVKTAYLNQTYAYANLDEYTAQLTQQNSQIQLYRDSLAEYTVRAQQSGVVHLSAGITVGTIIQAGTLLGSISSEDETTYYFETVLSATERSKVTLGSSAEIALDGVMQAEYGVLTGEIVAIDHDVTQTEDGQVFYRVRIKPHDTELRNQRGDTVPLRIGMVGESRIKYRETNWLKWMIEQIGIKFN